MRRRIVLGVVVLAVAVAGIAALTLPSAGAASARVGAWGRGWTTVSGKESAPPGSADKTRKMKFLATTIKLRLVDVNGNGHNDSGDYVIFTERLTNQAGTVEKGYDSVRCMFNSIGHHDQISMCDGEFVLTGRGEIAVYGQASPMVAVTGGTGDFSTVTGQARIKSINADSELITVWLTS
jgi:hypothetical protein